MRLIVGLGNPQPRYALTRHNVGYRIVRDLAQQHKVVFRRSPADGLTGKVTIAAQTCILLLPLTSMNDSGIAVESAVTRGRITLQNVLVIYDDMAIEFGRMRLRQEGGAGGHNGVKSIIERLGTNQFPRLRIGIGRPQGDIHTVDFVLNNFMDQEQSVLPEIIDRAIGCVRVWVAQGAEFAMRQYHDPVRSKDKINSP